MNVLSINPDTVICDPLQHYIRDKLDTAGITTVGINLRHSRTLGGGHHCTTLDTYRV
jgi:N-dimethylarginine dimethylaminohydrolase